MYIHYVTFILLFLPLFEETLSNDVCVKFDWKLARQF